MKITVLGTGYVGLTTATLLAHSGHQVYAIEPNKERLQVIQKGRSFFFEEGLDPLVNEVIKSGAMIATDSYEASVPESDVVFSCVGTPDNPDGSPNLTYVFDAAEKAAKLMKSSAIYVQKSTVPVGTGNQIKDLFKKLNVVFPYVSNPEFLRESTALLDTLYFDRVVVGSTSANASEKILELYKTLAKHRDSIAKKAGITAPTGYKDGEYIATTQNSAELIKVSANAFLALKISFANSIAKLADAAGADVTEVMDALGADPRIGRAFLNAGRGYGGGCFPKDVSGLISSAQNHGIDMNIMREAAELNSSMPGYIANKINSALPHGINNSRIAILGLAFKAGTSDARKSPAISLANILAKRGADVVTYDPEAIHEAREDLRPEIEIANSTEHCISNADVVCVATNWKEFISYNPKKFKEAMAGDLFVDAMNAYDIKTIESAGLHYIGVGRQGKV